jgi:hypothetical protein
MNDLLNRMRKNPAADWSMHDIGALCRALGCRCSPPSGGGSHFKISHPSRPEILTVPFRRPIKPVYIRKLVRFLDSVGGSGI